MKKNDIDAQKSCDRMHSCGMITIEVKVLPTGHFPEMGEVLSGLKKVSSGYRYCYLRLPGCKSAKWIYSLNLCEYENWYCNGSIISVTLLLILPYIHSFPYLIVATLFVRIYTQLGYLLSGLWLWASAHIHQKIIHPPNNTIGFGRFSSEGLSDSSTNLPYRYAGWTSKMKVKNKSEAKMPK